MGVVIEIYVKYPRGELELSSLIYVYLGPTTGTYMGIRTAQHGHVWLYLYLYVCYSKAGH
jgi:hypothetical protein